MYKVCKIKNYYFEQQNSIFKQELSLKQSKIDKFLGISSSQCKDISYIKEKGKKTSILQERKIPVAN